MAGLKKPVSCTCGSTRLTHTFGPERWSCVECSTVVVERPQRNKKGVCRECGGLESPELKFKPGKNLCVECNKKYMDTWKTKNIIHVKEYRGTEDFKRKRQAAVRRAVQRSSEGFLRHLSHSMVKKSNHRRVKLGRLNPACLDVQIDYEFLLDLYQRQFGKCAITGISMVHEFGNPASISIDRIDSTRGYVPDNVQLVCTGVNRAKNNHTQEQAIAFFRSVGESLQPSVVFENHLPKHRWDGEPSPIPTCIYENLYNNIKELEFTNRRTYGYQIVVRCEARMIAADQAIMYIRAPGNVLYSLVYSYSKMLLSIWKDNSGPDWMTGDFELANPISLDTLSERVWRAILWAENVRVHGNEDGL